MANKDDIEEIRRKKLEKYKDKAQSQQDPEEQQQEANPQKEALLKKTLTEDARRRLNTVQMARPEFGEQVENQIVALIQRGRINQEIDGAAMKQLLQELDDDDDDYNIKGMSSRTS